MRSSEQWWSEIKADKQKLASWLLDQYRGEATATDRIELLRKTFATAGSRADRVLRVVARQEARHAEWVKALLDARGIAAEVEDKDERYWNETLPGIDSLETGAAVGAHAEKMRLERIEAIANDDDAPADIRSVFAKILPQERFHERAFRSLTSPEAMAKTKNAHALGREALGLVA